MRLHRNQLPGLARNIVKALVDARDIELPEGGRAREVERDIEAVLGHYLDQADQAMSRAREITQQRGLPQGEFGRIKTLAAEQLGIKLGDDALDYVLDQLVEMLMRSSNVDEVYAADHQLRVRMRPFVVAEADLDGQVEAEVRGKLKHVAEGTRTWEIEYARIKEDIRRRRGV
ncbi:MAG: DUF507 family protein [Deltaproteobacteria bacterium]|nr:DUF507 family protein [Deltaproteobacteria bacterium]